MEKIIMSDVNAYSVGEYCAAERICRSKLYQEWAEGGGPRYYHRGSKRLISREAADAYRRQLEAKAMTASVAA
jgi:hypothetical protein